VTITQSKASTAERLIQAAQKLFLERNYADVTMDQICSEAQVTKGALYHYHSSKEELYLAMLHLDLANKKELFAHAAERQGNCRERLGQLTLDFLRLPPEQRELITLVRRDINIFAAPVRAELVRAYQDALPKQVQHILRDGILAGEIALADPRLMSWEFIALVEVALSPYGTEVYPKVEDKLAHILKVFFAGASVTAKES
jgi:AcrR family transcriptional regulator